MDDKTQRACRHCGKVVRIVASRHLLAHACPHGVVCVPTYLARRTGVRGGQCPACTRSQQLELPLKGL